MTMVKQIDIAGYFEILDSGVIRIRGHRINIEHILAYYLGGYSPEDIAREFPGLALEKIYATITYYLANQADVVAYLATQQREAEAAYTTWADQPSSVIERLRIVREQKDPYA